MDKLPRDINRPAKPAPPPPSKPAGRILAERSRQDEALRALAEYLTGTRAIHAGVSNDAAFNELREKLGVRGYASAEDAVDQMRRYLAL